MGKKYEMSGGRLDRIEQNFHTGQRVCQLSLYIVDCLHVRCARYPTRGRHPIMGVWMLVFDDSYAQTR